MSQEQIDQIPAEYPLSTIKKICELLGLDWQELISITIDWHRVTSVFYACKGGHEPDKPHYRYFGAHKSEAAMYEIGIPIVDDPPEPKSADHG